MKKPTRLQSLSELYPNKRPWWLTLLCCVGAISVLVFGFVVVLYAA